MSGWIPSNISGHSFHTRTGTSASSQRAPVHLMNHTGFWSSQANEVYIRSDLKILSHQCLLGKVIGGLQIPGATADPCQSLHHANKYYVIGKNCLVIQLLNYFNIQSTLNLFKCTFLNWRSLRRSGGACKTVSINCHQKEHSVGL